MKKQVKRIIQIAILLFVFGMMLPQLMAQPIPTSNGPIGSIINVSDSGVVKYWNGNAWIAVAPGLPGQSLQFVNGNPTWIYLTVTDIDGNIYNAVTIGTQTWMQQNLNVTHYRNGDAIPNVTDFTAWSHLTTGAYCDYNNAPDSSTTYGRLYNWWTVVDTRSLCPIGWHVPADSEWTTLTTYLGGESIAGGKLKEAGLTHWASPNTAATNETGFTALPAGYLSSSGTYLYIGYFGYWWSSPGGNSTIAWYRSMYYDYSNVYRNYSFNKTLGFSVRCVKD